MQSEEIFLEELILIGTTVRTNNNNEMNPENAKIGEHFHSYFNNKLADEFKDRCYPNVTYSVYTEFESDENGNYTHFIGEAVRSLEEQDLSKFNKLVIPASKYKKFTTASGKIPYIVLDAWQQIWKLNSSNFGGKRTYIADFEIYDQRAYNPDSAVVDIFIGIK